MSDNPECTEKCRTSVDCTVCKRRKAPAGRSVSMEAASGYCNFECDGYRQDPQPPHLWPNELIGDEQEPKDDDDAE